MALRKRWLVFAEAYLKGWNKTKAAEAAGYTNPGKAGYRLSKNVQIQAYIQARLDELVMSSDEALVRLSRMARADISDFVNDFGGIDWNKVRAKGYLVKKVRHNKGKNSEIELHDAKDTLVWIGKHHGLFTDRVEVVGLEDVLRGLPEELGNAVRQALAELVREGRS